MVKLSLTLGKEVNIMSEASMAMRMGMQRAEIVEGVFTQAGYQFPRGWNVKGRN